MLFSALISLLNHDLTISNVPNIGGVPAAAIDRANLAGVHAGNSRRSTARRVQGNASEVLAHVCIERWGQDRIKHKRVGEAQARF
jgi:hypothetical protein